MLDLAELDTKTAHLDLGIEPAEELEAAVEGPADAIAGAIEPVCPERVRHEAFRGQPRPVEIAARDATSADEKLSRGSDRHRLRVLIEHEEREVVDGAADDTERSRARVGGADAPVRHVHGRFGDPVHVGQGGALVAMTLEPAGQRGRVEQLTAEHDMTQRRIAAFAADVCRAGIDRIELGKGRRGLVEECDALAIEQLAQCFWAAAHLMRYDDRTRPP